MFNEDEDWSDGQDAQTLSKTVLKDTQETNNNTNTKVKQNTHYLPARNKIGAKMFVTGK